MERTQTLIIVIVIAALGLFGLRLMTGGSDEDEGMPLARMSRDRGADDQADVDGESGRAGESRGLGRRAGGTSRSAGGNADGGRAGVDGKGPAGGSRAAHTAITARSNRPGAAGVPGRGSGAPDGGTGSSIAPLAAVGARRTEANEPRRADVVEYLASQPSSGRHGGTDAGGEEPDGDVALEVRRPEDTEPAVLKKGVDGAEDDDGLTFSENAQLAFPDGGNVSAEEGTLSFQITPNWGGNEESNNSLVTWREEHAWTNRIELVKNGRYLRFILADNVGREADISVPIDAWIPGEEHDIKATWGDKRTSLYIDGALVGQNTYVEFKRPAAPLYIGSDHRGSSYSGLNGTLRGFKAINTASHS